MPNKPKASRGRPASVPIPRADSLLTVVRPDPERRNHWLCRCACGRRDMVSVRADRIKNGETTSCGHVRRESSADRIAASRENRWVSREKSESGK